MKTYNVAVLSGDGIGPEVMQEAIKVLDTVQNKFNFKLNYQYFDVGGIAIDKHNTPLPDETLYLALSVVQNGKTYPLKNNLKGAHYSPYVNILNCFATYALLLYIKD